MHRFSVNVALAAVFISAPLAAQGLAEDTTSNAPIVVASQQPIDFTARWTPASPGLTVTQSVPSAVIAPMFVPRQPSSRSTAMMLVGGAGLLVGAVVGGEGGQIIMIGGGVLGLYGLWQYLK